MIDTTDMISQAAEEALVAFWQVVARRFPQIKGGDLHFDVEIQLKLAAEQAIKACIFYNTPDDTPED
ncbi:MAG: hypothetical protein DCC65_02445 [Planctomycetota bacterium]|nr:MAG: hypothetical protein DCC65_02445 [Planctomycetota bacterium]